MPEIFDPWDNAQEQNTSGVTIFDPWEEKGKGKEKSGGFMGGFTRGLGLGTRAAMEGVTGLPAMVGDALNAAVNIGIDASNKLFGSNISRLQPVSQVISQGMTSAGLPEPETAQERLTSGIVRGGVGAATIPMGGMAATSRGVGGQAARMLGEMPVRQTISGMTGELAGGVAREMGAGPITQTALSMGGAMAPSALPNRATQAMLGKIGPKGAPTEGVRPNAYENNLPTRMAARSLDKARTSEGLVTNATPAELEMMRQRGNLAPVIEQNRANATTLENAIDGFRLDEARRSGDPTLIAKLQSMKGEEAQRLARIEELRNTNALGEYIGTALKTVEDPKTFLKEAQIVADETAVLRAQSVESVEKVMGVLEPTTPLDALGSRLRETLVGVKNKAQDKMNAIWNSINQKHVVDASPIETKINEIFGSYDEYYSQLKSIPNSILGSAEKGLEASKPKPSILYGPNDKLLPTKSGPPSMTIKELADFNNTITSNIRAANASGNSVLARNLHEVKNGIEQVIAAAADAPGVEAQKLKKFWDTYRTEYAPRFKRGQTAAVLKKAGSGDYSTLDVNVPSKYFLPGAKGKEAAKDFMATFGDNEVAMKVVRDYAAEDLVRFLGKKEVPTAKDLQKWVYARKDALEAYGMQDAFSNLDDALKVAGAATERLNVMNKAVFSKVLGVDPEVAVANIMESAHVDKNMGDLFNRIKNVPQMRDSLKTAVGNWFEKGIRSFEQTTEDGTLTFNANAAYDFAQKYKKPLSMLYSEQEMKAFNHVQAALKKMSVRGTPGGAAGGVQEGMAAESIIRNYTPIETKHRVLISTIKGLADPLRKKADEIVLEAIYNPAKAQRLYMLAEELKEVKKPVKDILTNFLTRQSLFQAGMSTYRQEGQ